MFRDFHARWQWLPTACVIVKQLLGACISVDNGASTFAGEKFSVRDLRYVLR